MASIDRLYGVGFRELVQGAADEDGVELALEEQPRGLVQLSVERDGRAHARELSGVAQRDGLGRGQAAPARVDARAVDALEMRRRPPR